MKSPGETWARLRRGGLFAAVTLPLLGVLVLAGRPQTTDVPEPMAREVGASAGPSFVLRARAVYPVTPERPGPIEHGMVIVRGGRIAAVGRDLEVPPDLSLIELPDQVICPGLVSAAGGLAGRHAGDESVSGAYRALDAFDTYQDYAYTLARGTTTAHLDPGGHRLVSGIGAVVKLAGPYDQRVLIDLADLTITLGVFEPPPLAETPFYASSDVAIEPAEIQRPSSRLGQMLELERWVTTAQQWLADPSTLVEAEFNVHRDTFIEAWAADLPLRVQARRATDIDDALAFIAKHKRPACLVDVTEGDRVVPALTAADVPVILRIDERYRQSAWNVGGDPDPLEPRLCTAGALAGLPRIALAGAEGDTGEDLRLVAILAVRGGMSPAQALAAITRVPAEILRVDERVGSLAPGKDADLLVLSDDPLKIGSNVQRVYIGGEVVYELPPSDAVVVKADTIWVGNGTLLHDASILIEDGKIQAVGQRVPQPPSARVIDAGAGSFVTPGFIDGYGHLGLAGDNTTVGPEVPIHKLFALPGPELVRVARAGVTTVMTAPYRLTNRGVRVAAIKTYGQERSDLVAREIGALQFSFLEQDPVLAIAGLRQALQAGREYVEKWKKYEEELAKWQKEGTPAKPEAKPKNEAEETAKASKPDPITGVWEVKLTGDPLPEEVTASMTLKLTGNTIQGRLKGPAGVDDEAELTGTLDGDRVELELDADTPLGRPKISAVLDREDHMEGAVKIGQYNIHLDATRTDKSPVEFKVQRKRTRSKDGRPLPPKVDDALEPYRALLTGKIPAVVEVSTAAQIDAVIKLFVDEFKVRLVLLGAEDAGIVMDKLLARKDQLGVVVPREMLRGRHRIPYYEAVDLSRKGIAVALQSDREDGARSLPLMGLYAVQQGMGGDAALRALTIDAARMYKLDERVGSLEPGKDGDVLIFTGHPFDAETRLERVIVGGQEVPHE